jgi:phospholipid/cholesterol/gamma-HCH transport system substrate-binding protein
MIVGATTLLALVGLFAFSYAGKKVSAAANVGTYPVSATFNRVDGLFEGDEVRLGGIRIGTVGSQVLDQSFRAVVTLNIDSAMQVPSDSAVAIHTDGLFGSKFVVVEPGVEDTMLKAGDSVQYTQGAVVVGELLELIISEGHARKNTSAPTDVESDTKTNDTQEGDN